MKCFAAILGLLVLLTGNFLYAQQTTTPAPSASGQTGPPVMPSTPATTDHPDSGPLVSPPAAKGSVQQDVIGPEDLTPETPQIITPSQVAPQTTPTTPEIVPKIEGPALEEIYLLGVDTHFTVFGGFNFTEISGDIQFPSAFGTPGDKLDFQDDLFLDDKPIGFRIGIDFQHERFHLAVDYSFTKNSGEGNITRDVTIMGIDLVSGAKISMDWDIHTFRITLGYTFYRTSWLGMGVEIPIGFVVSTFKGKVIGFPNDPTVATPVTIGLRSNLFVALPRIGCFLDIAPWERLVSRFSLFGVSYNIANRDILNYGMIASMRYYFTMTFFLFSQVEYQHMEITYKAIDSTGDTLAVTGGFGIRF